MVNIVEEYQSKKSVIVWRIVDGKPGHEAQTLGLVRALEAYFAVECYEVPACRDFDGFTQWLRGRFVAGSDLPKPDLIVGAGHRTHWSLLAAKRATGGKAVVLMKPSLPRLLFDLCIIPEHDGPAPGANVLITKGVLNPIQQSTDASPQKGLLLIGGPSTHHDWDSADLFAQIEQVVSADSSIQWTLTTSRRTPGECTEQLCALEYANLEVVPVERTPIGWVANQLGACGRVCVTEDSISMIYEALTSGAVVGLFSVPRKRKLSRVVDAIETLVAEQHILRFDKIPKAEIGAVPPLNEARRCAEQVCSLLKR